MVEGFPLDGTEEASWGLLGEGAGGGCVVGAGGEGEGPGLEHAFRKVGGVGERGHSKVAEHGVRLPAAKELDDVGVHARA